MKTIAALASLLMACTATAAVGQDSTLNTKWHSEYESFGGPEVSAKVTLKKSSQDQFGTGKYVTPFGDGTFSQVRKEIGPRSQTQPIPANSPLPGPNSPTAGATQNEAVYIKGLWHFQGTTGYFSWELYETPNGTCKFIGKWGFIDNNQAGPTRGKWTGTLDTGNSGGQSGPNPNSPVVDIPF